MTEEEKDIWDAVYQTGDMLTKPAAAVEWVTKNLEAPRGALAGGVKAAMDNTDIIEGIKRGWEKNTSWGETFIPEETRKEHPTASFWGGLAMDVVADPLWLVKPASIANKISDASRAVGLTEHIIDPIVNKVTSNPTAQRAIANIQDWAGLNRVNDAGINTTFNQGRAEDLLHADDLVDGIRDLKKAGGNAEDVTRYIEAAENGLPVNLDAARRAAIMDSSMAGTLADDIARGLYTKEEALAAHKQSAGMLDDAMQAQSEARNLVRQQQAEVNQLQKLAETEQGRRQKEIDRLMGERDSVGKAVNEVDEAKAAATLEKEERLQAGKNTIADNREALRAENAEVDSTIKDWQEDVGKIREATTTRKLKRQNLKNRLKEINRELKANSKIKISDNPTPMEESILQKREALLQEKESIINNLDDLKAQDAKAGQDIKDMNILKGGVRLAQERNAQETGERIAALQSSNRAMESGIESANDVTREAQSLMRERRGQVHGQIQRARKESEIKQAFENDDVVKATDELVKLQEKLVKSGKDLKRARQGTKIPDYLLQQHQIDAIAESSKNQRALMEAYRDAKSKGMDDTAAMIREAMKKERVRAYANLPDYVTREKVLSEIKDENLRKAVQAAADPIIEKMKKDSDTLRDLGLLDNKDYVHFMGGSHLRRAYEKFDNAEDYLKAIKEHGTAEEYQKAFADHERAHSNLGGASSNHKIDMKDFIKRQRLSSETMKGMGLITDAEYRVLDTLDRSSKAIRENQYLKDVAEKFGKTAKEAAELSRNLPPERAYKYVPDSPAYGELAGKWIPADVEKQVRHRVGEGEKPGWWKKAVAHWKIGRLASPDAVARNFYSGLPMANVFGGVPLYKMPMLMKDAAIAMKQGKNSNLWREYQASGAKQAKLARSELEGILDGGQGVKASLKKGDMVGVVKGVEEKAMKAFGAPDDFWRLVTFAYYRKKGMSVKDAGEKARTALFDYENTPEWVQKLARNGVVPFGRFAYHAAKGTAKAAWNDPAKLSSWGKYQNQTDDDVKQLYPEYLKPHNLVPLGESTRTVKGKEQKILDNVDVQYISPFSTDVSAGGPAFDLAYLLRSGQNSLGQQIIRPGMSGEDKAKAYAEQVTNMVLPKVMTKGYLEKFYNAAQGNVDKKGRQYDMSQVVQQNLGGIKHVPVNVKEMYMQRMMQFDQQISEKEKEINRIEQDERLSNEEKKREIKKYVGEIKKLVKDSKQVSKAYKSYKRKAGGK